MSKTSDKVSIRISLEAKAVLDSMAASMDLTLGDAANAAILSWAKSNTLLMSDLPEFSQVVLQVLFDAGEDGLFSDSISRKTGYTIKRVAAVLGSLMAKNLVCSVKDLGGVIIITPMGIRAVKE